MKKIIFWLILLLFGLTKVVGASEPVYIYNIEPLFGATDYATMKRNYDYLLSLVSLQGIVNRSNPRIFFEYEKTKQYFSDPGRDIRDFDKYWWNQICVEVAEKCTKGDLAGREVRRYSFSTTKVADFINMFKGEINGVVIWDGRVPATSNVAASVAGADNLIPVEANIATDSMQSEMARLGIPVRVDLYAKNFGGLTAVDGVTNTGSAKNNAYRWLVDKYVKSGKLNPEHVGYYTDAAFYVSGNNFNDSYVMNLDSVIENKGIIVDLSPWRDELPSDDSRQRLGLDRETWEIILSTAHDLIPDRLIRIEGYVPWTYKYTVYGNKGGHGVVDSEHESVVMFSKYNAMLSSADAPGLGEMPNGSFYRKVGQKWRTPLNDGRSAVEMTKRYDPDKKYLLWMMGDYDSSSWFYSAAPLFWDKQAGERGKYPIAWMVSPQILDKAPFIYDYVRERKTPKDFFISYEGVGYIDPNLSPNLTPITNEGGNWYSRNNLSLTGFLISNANGLTGSVKKSFSSFSKNGVSYGGVKGDYTEGIDNQMPFITRAVEGNAPFTEDWSHLVTWINKEAWNGGRQFLTIRTVLSSPKLVADTMSHLDQNVFEAVDPITFGYLIRDKLGGNSDYKILFLDDSLPEVVVPDQIVNFTLRMKNIGRKPWQRMVEAMGLAVTNKPIELADGVVPKLVAQYDQGGRQRFVNATVNPGEEVTIDLKIKVPATVGEYVVQGDMVVEGIGWMENLGNLPWTKKIKVMTSTTVIPTIPTTIIKPSSTPVLPSTSPVKIKGDATGDGVADILDFARWRSEYISGSGLTSDFNNDNKIDILDFGEWRKGYLGK